MSRVRSQSRVRRSRRIFFFTTGPPIGRSRIPRAGCGPAGRFPAHGAAESSHCVSNRRVNKYISDSDRI
eukprot:714668-Hanusia_phi.AAC.1